MEQTSPPLPRASVVHMLPGRVRLRVPAHQGDPAFFARVVERMSDAPGIRTVRGNPATASVLVVHDAAAGVEGIARLARERGLFDLAAPPPGTAILRAPGAAVPRRRPAPVPLLMLTAAGLAGLGTIQSARGHFHGNTAESLWNAYTVYVMQGQPAVAAGLFGLGLYQLVTGRVLGSGASLFLYALAARNLARGKPAGEVG